MSLLDFGGMRNLEDESHRDFRLGSSLYALLLHVAQPLSRDITLVRSRL